MAVVRRNILLAPEARDSYIRGVNLLKREMQGSSGLSTYDSFVVWHHQTMMRLTPPNNGVGRNAAHRGPVFLPWHRYMLMALELQLQRVLDDVDFGLPYWDWAADGDLPRTEQPRSAVWGSNCMGGVARQFQTVRSPLTRMIRQLSRAGDRYGHRGASPHGPRSAPRIGRLSSCAHFAHDDAGSSNGGTHALR